MPIRIRGSVRGAAQKAIMPPMSSREKKAISGLCTAVKKYRFSVAE